MLKRLFPVVFLLPLLLNAAQNTESDGAAWKGEGELGYTATSGNTDSENLNASLGVSRQANSWKHAASIKSIRNKADDVTSADSIALKGRSEYRLNERSYAFGQLRYEEDEFSGYDRQTSIAFGLGSRFLDNDRQLLDLSVGLGYSSSQESGTGDDIDDAILTASLDYRYKISESATFGQTILLESGDENTHSESDTSLRAKINGNLATKISYLVKHNSDVPDGTDKSDEIVTLSLVYAF